MSQPDATLPSDNNSENNGEVEAPVSEAQRRPSRNDPNPNKAESDSLVSDKLDRCQRVGKKDLFPTQ